MSEDISDLMLQTSSLWVLQTQVLVADVISGNRHVALEAADGSHFGLQSHLPQACQYLNSGVCDQVLDIFQPLIAF